MKNKATNLGNLSSPIGKALWTLFAFDIAYSYYMEYKKKNATPEELKKIEKEEKIANIFGLIVGIIFAIGLSAIFLSTL